MSAELTQPTRDHLAHEMAETYAEVQRLRDEAVRVSTELGLAKKKLIALHDAMGGALIEITDHAVLRYAERVLGLNQDEVRAIILAKVAPLVRTLGDGKYPVGSGCMAVVHKGVVVSVVPA